MQYRAIVAGTGFDGRDQYIRRFGKPGAQVTLRREPDNPHDPNAIAVDMLVVRWYTLFRPVRVHIGYIKKSRAASLAKRIDSGGRVMSATIDSMDLYYDHPRVSLLINTDW